MIEDDRVLSIRNVRLQCEKFNELYSLYPGGVERLLFLETDGNQIIDTGFIPDKNSKVIFDAFIYTQDSYPRCLFGIRNGQAYNQNTGSAFGVWLITSTRYDDYYNKSATSINIETIGRPVIEKNGHTLTINGITVSAPDATITPGGTMFIFGNNTSGLATENDDTRRTKCIFYSCQIYDNGTLVRDYIPARKQGTVGLYDIVNEQFYENVGSGNFVAGPTRSIPKDYVELEYLQSNPTNNTNGPYINTGLKASNGAIISSKFQLLSETQIPNHAVHGMLFGVRDTSSPNYSNRLCFGKNSQSGTAGWRYDYRANNNTETSSVYTNAIVFSAYDNKAFLSDSTSFSNSKGTFESSYPIYLFSSNTAGSSSNCGYLKIFYIYMKTSDGERYFVPVKRKSDNELGMFDIKNQVFYAKTDATKEDFTGGNELAEENTTPIFSNIFQIEDEEKRIAYLNIIDDFGNFGLNRSLGNVPISASNLKRIFMTLLSDGTFPDYTKLEYLESNDTFTAGPEL